MEKLIASFSALILIAFIFSSCTESLNTETSSSAPSAAPGGKGTFSTEAYCANNWFPQYEDNTANYYIKYCPDGPDVPVSMYNAAGYWSRYMSDPNDGPIIWELCDITNPDGSIKPVSSLQGYKSGNYPKLQWAFIFSHFYIVQRKIGTGAWETIATINNKGVYPLYDYSGGAYASYIDATRNVNIARETTTYRVYTKIFDQLASSAAEYTYPAISIIPPANFDISPRRHSDISQDVTITWTPSNDANVTGYKIYRSFNNYNGPFALIATINSRDVGSYVDGSVNWKNSNGISRYYFRMCSYSNTLNMNSGYTTTLVSTWSLIEP